MQWPKVKNKKTNHGQHCNDFIGKCPTLLNCVTTNNRLGVYDPEKKEAAYFRQVFFSPGSLVSSTINDN
jgi:hypothetical protein